MSSPTRRANAEDLFLELGEKVNENSDNIPCRNAPDLWFADDNGLGSTYQHLKEARQGCAACPVQALCAEYAIVANEEFGIWGGLTPSERRGLFRRFQQRGHAVA